MCRLLLFSLIFLFLLPLNAQIIHTDPPFPSEDQPLTFTFDASLGSGGLEDYTGTVYVHTGVITDRSTSSIDWRYVKTDWGENTPETRLTRIDENKYQLTISPNIREYYEVPTNEKIESIALVFRSAQPVGGSYLEGKTADFGDIFIDLFNDDAGFLFRITQPTKSNLIIDQNEFFVFKGFTSQNADLSLYDNGQLLLVKTDSKSLEDTVFADQNGNHDLVFEAIDSAGNVYRDSIRYIVPASPPVAALTEDFRLGAHRLGNDSVRFVLDAPGKQEVWILGSFTDWKLDTEQFQMNRTPGGKYFWLDVEGLDTAIFHTYQYLVDREIYVADPLSEIVLDPSQDEFIGDVWPGLPAYPEQAVGAVTLLDLRQFPYAFQHTAPFISNDQMVVYELLIRDFLQDHSYESLLDTLDYLQKLGVNAIELMPVQEFEGNISWGYNPSFHGALDKYYGRPEALKAFIDEAHSRDMIVLLDVVYNHAFSQSPHCQLYWDAQNFRPSAQNPWLNVTAMHPFNVGYDYNHQYEGTQRFVKETLRRWLEDYQFDGFRFDLSKGFTQRFTNDVGQWGTYEADRIALLKDYAQTIWQINPQAKVILEHFAENREEKELAEYGMLLWNNINHAYNEATLGFHASGRSNFSGTYYKQKNWTVPHAISYMESHDEERLMVKNLSFGNSSGSYDIRELGTALDRVEAATAFFYAIPGPNMLWQFGELGNDLSINRCPNGTIDPGCRTAPKPIRWNYLNIEDRADLFRVTADMIHLKTQYGLFNSDKNVALDLNSAVKRLRVGDDVMVLGNFDVIEREISAEFLQSGKWYEFFSGDSIDLGNNSFTDNFAAGEYRLYLKQKIERPSEDVLSFVLNSNMDRQVQLYPNPASDFAYLSFEGPLQHEDKVIYLFSESGQLLYNAKIGHSNTYRIPLQSIKTGMYQVIILGSEHQAMKKLIVIN